MQKRISGFTLMELLVVIAIIGILAGLLLPALSSSKTAARRKRAQTEASQIETALRSYYTDNRAWLTLAGASETSASVVGVLRGDGGKIPYLELSSKNLIANAMVDPWGNTYKLALCVVGNNKITANGTGLYRTCAVWSKGPNGKEDGDVDGTDDVMSWK